MKPPTLEIWWCSRQNPLGFNQSILNSFPMTLSIFPSSLSQRSGAMCSVRLGKTWRQLKLSWCSCMFMQHSELVQKDQGTPPPKKVFFKCGLLSVLPHRPTVAYNPYPFRGGSWPICSSLRSFVLQIRGADVYTLPMLPALVPLTFVLAPILSARSISRQSNNLLECRVRGMDLISRHTHACIPNCLRVAKFLHQVQ